MKNFERFNQINKEIKRLEESKKHSLNNFYYSDAMREQINDIEKAIASLQNELKEYEESLRVFEEIKSNLDCECYELYDSSYCDYDLFVCDENEKILISISDNEGHATCAIDKKEFINQHMENFDTLDTLISEIFHYNYILNY